MSIYGELTKLGTFKKEMQEMNRKLDRIIELLKMLVELQCEDSEKEFDEPEIE